MKKIKEGLPKKAPAVILEKYFWKLPWSYAAGLAKNFLTKRFAGEGRV
jgi:hypothetical protein